MATCYATVATNHYPYLQVLVVQGYAVSWSTLLTARLRSAWPGTCVTTASM